MEYDKLMTRLKQGDIKALEILYNELHVALYAFSLSIVKKHDAASDIIQDTFLKIYNNASSYKEGTNAKAWIYSIVRNLSIDYLRKQKKFIRFTDVYDQQISTTNEAYDDLATYELLKYLDDTSSQIVLLYVFEGFKHAEIAQILKMKEGTVRWKYREALKLLEKKLRGDDCGSIS